MPIEITMPRLSDTMEQGTVVKWHVAEGDTVSSGDVLADIETDKATMELESFDDGTVAGLAIAEGESARVGEVIVVLLEEGEDASDAAAPAAASKAASGADTPPAAQTAVAEPPAPASSGSNGAHAPGARVFASPLARKIAADSQIDLHAITGTGPSGRITRKDVEAAIGAGTAAPPAAAPPLGVPVAGRVATPATPAPLPPSGATLEEKTVPLSNMRAVIAKRLVESKITIPHYQVTVSARMDALETLRAQLNEQLVPQGIKLSVNDFLVRTCALAMHQHPVVNASWLDQGPAIQYHASVNVGVAIALPEERGGGLVVATLRNADRIGLRQISADTKRLAKKAREKGLSVEEMSDSTFTVSNLGMFGVDHFTAIINPPNAAILAVGRAIERPFFETNDDGDVEIVLGSEMAMTMSSDHRLIDGATAAQYLGAVKELLENPATLLV